MNLIRLAPVALASLLLLTACPEKKSTTETTAATEQPSTPKAPAFNADSAYAYTAKQVAFGPRVPNSPAHVKAGDWIVQKFKSLGLSVKEQPFTAMAFDGKMLRSRNIIAQYQPQAARRIAIFTHWDTRPFADKDKTNKNAPLDGASDGASGVGIALEMARVLAAQQDSLAPGVGVDFILFDSEDYGYDSSTQGEKENLLARQEANGQSSWCLGSQYWAKNMVPANYKPSYGILLDMVGAKDAKFSREELSRQQARDVVDKVWNTASQLGFSDFFLFNDSYGITDDHVYTNQAGVRTIDIIDHVPVGDEYFPAYHHTTQDNMSVIDKRTLKAVGQTVLTTIYGE
ncbi:M28 family peptidase [Hymenobacter taeanensis]|uniref:M28 family peptidase n=1 Tax=Hymenobacter taeanensis TaxID=2735321 RepID=A0A6M6BDG6_9BACT|nr:MULTISPECIES: M28 family peptidase [Hymenobacter]QJX46266.1 M28 family peptidase [Hymenobacter taeanensis]UOQ80120.1 M28 family peptidase [Hymenobacter sp. 5414T-23]